MSDFNLSWYNQQVHFSIQEIDMTQRQTVHDLELLALSATSAVSKNVLMVRAYYSGLKTGLLISNAFVKVNALSLSGRVWDVLKGETFPTPAISESIAFIYNETFSRVVLEYDIFVSPELRYGQTEKIYAQGMADGVMVGLVEVPRLMMACFGDNWQINTLTWLSNKVYWAERQIAG